MKRSTYLMIDVVCFFASLLGALNFSFDRRSGIARIKTHITIYSAVATIAIIGIIIHFLITMEIKTRTPGRAELKYRFNVLLMITRAAAIITTILYNWINLSDFVKFINAYRNFSLKFIRKWRAHEQYEKHLEQGIRLRCQCSILSDIITYFGTVAGLQDIFDVNNNLILILAFIPTLLYVAMSFYYITILNANVLMIIINDELKRILATAFILHQNHSKATLARHGQTLAKELDELAESQHKIKAFLRRLNNMFDPQGACLLLDLYINNIFVIYLLCLFCSQDEFFNGHEHWQEYLLPIFFVIYYMDLKVFMYAILKTMDLMDKTAEILKGHYYLGQQMEKCLKKSFTNYYLQLAIDPLENEVLGLYKLNRAMVFANFSSTISNAIVLIQYDFKHSK